MKKNFALVLVFFSCQSMALTVVMEDGCPVRVDPGPDACQGDPGAACKNPGAVVRWSSSATINEIGKKGGTAELHNCKANGPADYQCIVKGNSGEYVDYYVIANDCELDPRIILK